MRARLVRLVGFFLDEVRPELSIDGGLDFESPVIVLVDSARELDEGIIESLL